jgi:Domain of unknown function (DUF4333)
MSVRVFVARPFLILGLAALIVAGCSTTLDNVKLQQSIVDGLQQQAGVTAEVTCPNDRPIKQGDIFTCTATTADGQTLTITVTQTDSNGQVHWEVTGS